jgi:hypothetical protein
VVAFKSGCYASHAERSSSRLLQTRSTTENGLVALPPSATPPLWTNQPLTLYHGTLDIHIPSILQAVDVRFGRIGADFGPGFYTTTVDRQALSWAWQLAQRRPGSVPAIVRFDVDRDASATLDCMWFVRGTFDADDFWSMVFSCRQGAAGHGRSANQGWYDVVVGPVAASWRQRLIIYDADQVSFHTPRAAQVLTMSNPRRVL